MYSSREYQPRYWDIVVDEDPTCGLQFDYTGLGIWTFILRALAQSVGIYYRIN